MKLNNKYYIMRHGQAISNVNKIYSSWPETFENPLTDLGRDTVKESVQKLKDSGAKIDLIYNSPLLRTKQTAEIAGQILEVKPVEDKNLKEIDFGSFNGKHQDLMWASVKAEKDRIKKGVDGGESYEQVLNRMKEVVYGIEEKYENKNILLVSHEGPSFLLQGWFNGFSIEKTVENSPAGERIHKAEIREIK